jgi:hypothetical protein
MKTQLTRIIIALALFASLHRAPAPSALGTAFTYQGRLNDNGSPANGSYDLSFSLYVGSSGGVAAFGPLTNSATGVTNGLFTVTLDFGSGVFNGLPYWLDISVRTNGNGAFAELSPRQQLTPVPYAVFSESAGTAATANGVAAGSVTTADIASGQVVKSLNGLEDAVTLSPGANVTITPNGNTLTIASIGGGGGSAWSLTGNLNTTGSNFLGTLDNQPLELWVNSARALRLEPDGTGGNAPNVIGGASNNMVSPGNGGDTVGGGYNNAITGASYGSTIAGGVHNTANGGGSQTVGGGVQNTVGGLYSTVSGGEGNTASTNGAAVGGGGGNTASGRAATVSGGEFNTASGDGAVVGGGGYDGTTSIGNSAASPASTVGGGLQNVANASYATVGGGYLNTAGGLYAAVPGGLYNSALGPLSFAAGHGAVAQHSGAFVWSDDSSGTQFSSTANNQFSVRATGGVRFITGNAGLTVNGQPVLTGGGGGVPIGWGLTGNTNTDPSVNYLGTADDVGLELRVNNSRAMRLDPIGRTGIGQFNGVESSVNLRGGWWENTVLYGSLGATIAGGGGHYLDQDVGDVSSPNTVTGDFGTVGGGNNNTAGYGATVPGGIGNSATGNGSFAAGRDAHTIYDGSFVWGDGTRTFSGFGNNHFEVLATGGASLETSLFSVLATGWTLFETPYTLIASDVTANGGVGLQLDGKYLEVTGLGNELAYFGSGDASGIQIEIGSLKHGTTDAIFYNLADSKYMHLFCGTITITGGADLAEPFQISTADKEVAQGAVLVIDEENPGHLKLSDQPYDTRVAGVVSGANGINPGIQMQQQGLLEGGKNVALTGRVYVQADVSNGPIKPGDLLTSSTIPGHAMKVSDHARAQGAILGKAMTGLKDGKGMVLVLVTLQ